MTKKPSMGERVTGAMFWNSALLPVKTALTFVSSFVIVRALSQGDYAVFAAIIALITSIGQWVDLGIENTIAKFLPEIEQRFGRGGLLRFMGALLLFKFILLALVFIPLIVFWNAIVAYFHLGKNDAVFLLIMALLLFLGVVSDFVVEFLISYFNQKAANSMDVSNGVVQPILIIIFIWLGGGVAGVLWARVVATVLYILIGLAFAWPTFTELAPVGDFKGSWRNLTQRFARLSAVAYFSSITLYFSDVAYVVVVLTSYGDLLGVALFDFAFRRVLAPVRQFLTSSLWGVPIPLFARLYVRKDLVKLQEAYGSMSRFMTLLLVPSAVGLCMLTANIVRLYAQSRYEPAASIAIVLTILLFGETLFHPAQLVLVAFEEMPIFFTGRVLTLLSIPLLFLVTPTFGALGAAWVIGLVRVGSRLYFTLMIRRKFGLAFPFSFLFKVSAASMLMAAAMLVPLGLDRPHDVTETVVRTTLAFCVGSLTFMLAFKRLGSIEASDKEKLATLRIPFKRVLLNWL